MRIDIGIYVSSIVLGNIKDRDKFYYDTLFLALRTICLCFKMIPSYEIY